MRDILGNLDYWNKWIDFVAESDLEKINIINSPVENQDYLPQFIYKLSSDFYEQIFRCYSRGDSIPELVKYFPLILEYWEKSEILGDSVWSDSVKYNRKSWEINIDYYMVCFWLVGLALALEIPDDQWRRLIALIGNEGNDILLDRIIATRQVGRKIGTQLCHPKPYRRLLEAIDASPDNQAVLLRGFLDNWFTDLGNPSVPGKKKLLHDRPYWHAYLEYDFEGGAYFGQWCVEAVAAVKAFDLNDELCLGHRHYPGDLLRPNGPSTHPFRPEETIIATPKQSFFARIFKKVSA